MKEKKFDVVALGELLIDFTESGMSEQHNPMLEANPGGAPCNVLAMLQKLGKKTAFIGKVGNDIFGKMLKECIENIGIDSTGLCMDDSVNTTLAFVHTLANGDREFSFYRNPGADMMLTPEEVSTDLLENTKIFHFGTLSMTHEKVEFATKRAVDKAKENGCLISFDPNLREPLWSSLEKAKEKITYGLSVCDILKISDNEIQFITGIDDCKEGMQKILEMYPIPIAFATFGKQGSAVYYNGNVVEMAGFENPNTIETTGAGDTFMACVLNYLLEHGLKELSKEMLSEMLRFANAGASIITTRKGALKVMPSKEEIEDFLEQKLFQKSK